MWIIVLRLRLHINILISEVEAGISLSLFYSIKQVHVPVKVAWMDMNQIWRRYQVCRTFSENC